MKNEVKKKKCWFYSEQVKEHFFNPKNIFKTDEEAKNYKADGVGTVGSPACGDVMKMWIKVDHKTNRITECKYQTFGCFINGEEIHTPNGFIEIDKFNLGDTVYNHKGEEAIIEETYREKYDGKILRIIPLVSKFNTLSVTGMHPILVVKRKWLKNEKQKHTDFLRIKNLDELKEIEPEFVLAKEIEKGDYLIYQYPKKIVDDKRLTLNHIKLLGYYLSEGYLMSEEKKSGEYGTLAFSFNKNEKNYIEELKKLLKICFKKDAKERTRGNVSEIYICNRNAIRFFDKYCSHMAKKKTLHKDLMLLPRKKQEILLEYYFKGDGHIYKDKRGNRQNQFYMTTASKQLAFQLQTIIARLGYFATISKRMTVPSVIDGRVIESKESYVIVYIKNKKKKYFVKKTDDYFLVPISKIEQVNHTGYVNNLQITSKNKSYLAKGFAVHNCASAIASTSILSVMVTENGGMKIEDAMKIRPADIIKGLGGLPARKVHCSVLGDQALRAAINDYLKKG